MDGIGYSAVLRESRRWNEHARLSPRERALEEQAFYERFGRVSTSGASWKAALKACVAPIVAVTSLVGAVVLALRDSIST
jgi:hypothetical protein